MPDATAGYPVMLNLQDRQVAVIGGGRVATRKARDLLAAGARVLVISPRLSGALKALAEKGEIQHIEAPYQRDMLNDYMPQLVITATDDERANRIAAQDAERIRALCNRADDSAEGDFSNMAQISKPPLTIALSANGSSPALLRQLKTRLDASIGGEYAILSQWLGETRQPLKAAVDGQIERQLLYERVLDSDVLTLLREDRVDCARRRFQQIMNEAIAQ